MAAHGDNILPIGVYFRHAVTQPAHKCIQGLFCDPFSRATPHSFDELRTGDDLSRLSI